MMIAIMALIKGDKPKINSLLKTNALAGYLYGKAEKEGFEPSIPF
jgi:hypothetical protein